MAKIQPIKQNKLLKLFDRISRFVNIPKEVEKLDNDEEITGQTDPMHI